jgi:hypothetical protein
MARFFFHVTNGSTFKDAEGGVSKPRGLMLLKLPASSGKTGAMRAGITGTDSTYERGKLGSRSGDLDISGGYETVKCHWAYHFPNFRLRSRTVRNCAHDGTDKPDLHLRSGIAIIPPPRPAFVGGKGSPCEKKKGSLYEEES